MSPRSSSVVPVALEDQPSLYERDFHAWADRQAALFRAGRLDELDLDNLAEELDGLSKDVVQRLESALTVLYMHMLKWDFQPKLRSRSWEATIREQRKRIARLLAKNPSLKATLDEAMIEGYDYGRDRASGETNLPLDSFPAKSEYTWEDVTEREFRIDEPAVSKRRPIR